MPLRVTQSMMSAQLLRNITNNVSRMNNHENQLSTGRKINKPSDDPVGITYSLRYRSEIAMNDQYQRNLDSAKSSIEYTDTILGNLTDLMQRANELTVRGVSGTNPQEALDAIAKELDQIRDLALSLGNEQMNGKYIFNGQMTDKKPYTDGTESTDDGAINLQFAAGVTAPINATGNEVFGRGDDADNLFAVLKEISDAFKAGDQERARAQMQPLTDRLDKMLQVRSDVGARSNRVDLMVNRLSDLGLNLESMVSKTEDADVSEVITKLKVDESVYQASLSTGAKIIQPTLVDYIR